MRAEWLFLAKNTCINKGTESTFLLCLQFCPQVIKLFNVDPKNIFRTLSYSLRPFLF